MGWQGESHKAAQSLKNSNDLIKYRKRRSQKLKSENQRFNLSQTCAALMTLDRSMMGQGLVCTVRSSVQTLPEASALYSLAEGGQSRSDEEGMQKTKATQRQRKSKATEQKHVDEIE